LIAGFMVFIIFIAHHILIITIAVGTVEAAAGRVRDSLPNKQTAIDEEYSSGAITAEESIARKTVLLWKKFFYEEMEGDCKLISISEKCKLFIIALTILGGFLFFSAGGFVCLDGVSTDKHDIPGLFIGMVFFEEAITFTIGWGSGIPDSSAFGILLSTEQIIDAVTNYLPLIIANGVLSMLPALLISVAVGVLIKKDSL